MGGTHIYLPLNWCWYAETGALAEAYASSYSA
jgi:hypothetical protein